MTEHWHGGKKHSHEKGGTSEHEHSPKIRVILSGAGGVGGKRRDAVRLISLLAKKHEEAKLKETDEEILTVFMRPDAVFGADGNGTGGTKKKITKKGKEHIKQRRWIDTVTDVLVTPLQRDDAISFVTASSNTFFGETTSLGIDFTPTSTQARSNELSDTNGASYPTPILLNGGITVMKLDTFVKLLSPASWSSMGSGRDDGLMTEYGADVEMSLALWNCGNGVHVLPLLKAGNGSTAPTSEISKRDGGGEKRVIVDKGGYTPIQRDAVRLASVWTAGSSVSDKKRDAKGYDDTMTPMEKVIFKRLAKRYRSDINVMQMAMQQIRKSLPLIGLGEQCRSFEWFMKTVNNDFEDLEVVIKELNDHKPERIESDQKMRVDDTDNEKEEEEEEEEIDEEAEGNDDAAEKDGNIKQPLKNKKQIVTKTQLSAFNLEIISRTHPINLSFTDPSSIEDEQPRLGAVDEDGRQDYIHDEKSLRNNPPTFHLDNKVKNCANHDDNYKMLTKRVAVDIDTHNLLESQAKKPNGKPRAKIFCTVYTIAANHDRLPPILQTWGPRCDGFMVASDKTDPELKTVNIRHEGEEAYGNIWQKVRAIWKYVYDNYYEGYDWFHIGGDDLYVLVENLRLYLESDEIILAANGGKTLPVGGEEEAIPLFLGRRFKEQGNEERIFNSGGSGYTMNRAALKALVVDAFPTCMPHLTTFAEDVMVAQCLRNKVQVFPYDTKDEEGSERYMPFNPGLHLVQKLPKDSGVVNEDWYFNYSIDIKEGFEHCSKRSVAFHYIKPPLMNRMHAILYGHCT